MRKITLSIFILACFLCSSILQAQIKSDIKRTSKPSPDGIYRCSSDEYNAELLKQYPNMMGSRSFEKKLENKIKELKASKTRSVNGATLVRIPVVVHVIHNGTAIGVGANISDAQVLSQIQVLNEDFRKLAGTRGENSHPDGADTNIEFYLAREDADCNPTTGIDRLDLSNISTTWSGPGGNSDSVLKPMTIWDPSRYLNMWTVTLDDNTLLGYAQFPGGPAETDGVVMGYEYFGSNDAPGVTLSGVYNLGRTTTHEVGHFFGLFHTFDGGCSDGDLVADTPPTADTDGNYGCPTGLDSCPVGTPDGILDMIENYMDYTDDACMNIFTNGQSARMDAVLAGLRASLANSTVPDTPLAPVNYDGSIKITSLNLDPCSGTFTPEVRLANYGTVTLTSATIAYDLNNGTPANYNWTGSLAEGQSEIVNLPTMVTPVGNNDFNVEVSQSNTDQRVCNDTDSDSFIGVSYDNTTQIHLTLNTDDFAEEISWEFKDSSNTVLYSQTYTNSPANDNATFNYSFDVVVDECYTFTISDSAGDGICCAYGTGSYELRADDNSLIASGGSYAFSETTTMSTTALSMDDYFKNNKVSIYPNPTQTDLTISLLNPKQLPNGFQVYNMLGQAIFSKSISTKEDLKINTSILSNGMYFIKISKGSRSIAIPFIKK
ncbi:putative secreted protein (Por secretion system target) [Flavobacteriaceae bacterium MAR_2010_105]|nr:putative secreted protein (Por secretion system target) [Flavobacteriaceae bacterium MAR_2010_105]